MTEVTAKRLEYLCIIIPPLLEEIDEIHFSAKPSPSRWSKKEILGHLIDSATNNHHRLVLGQFEDHIQLAYDQDKWVDFSHYTQMDTGQLIDFWASYNRQLAWLIKCIPEAYIEKEYLSGDGKSVTLSFLIQDYLLHLEHHLRQLVSYT